jgi:hypothetical protein
MAPKNSGRTFPPVPATVHSILGPIAVRLVDGSPDPKDADCLGLWEPAARTITLRRDVAPEVLWQTLWHERMHAILWHASVRLSRAKEEDVCDALGTAMCAEMMARED